MSVPQRSNSPIEFSSESEHSDDDWGPPGLDLNDPDNVRIFIIFRFHIFEYSHSGSLFQIMSTKKAEYSTQLKTDPFPPLLRYLAMSFTTLLSGPHRRLLLGRSFIYGTKYVLIC